MRTIFDVVGVADAVVNLLVNLGLVRLDGGRILIENEVVLVAIVGVVGWALWPTRAARANRPF
jgi:hypothetical protein